MTTDPKAPLRHWAKQYRAGLDRRQKVQKDADITAQLWQLPQCAGAPAVVLYAALPREIDTLPIIEQCIDLGKQVYLPRVVGRQLQLVHTPSTASLRIGAFSVPEPTGTRLCGRTDLPIVVPGLAFDRQGYRAGYGKGYYDRLLANWTGFKIGLCYRDCLFATVHPHLYDIPVDQVLTEETEKENTHDQ